MKTLIASLAILCVSLPAFAQESVDTSQWFDDPDTLNQTDGGDIYASVCAGCHMPNGQGAQGAGDYPALANNPRVQAAAYPVSLVINGRKAMPSLGHLLDDEQVASVVNYIRTHLGNDYTANPASAELVSSMR